MIQGENHMRIFNIIFLLVAALQMSNAAYAHYCDDLDYEPPPGCRCLSYNLICSKPRVHTASLGNSVVTLGLAPHCSPENKKYYCKIDCTIYDSNNKSYLDIQCLNSCMSEPCQ